MGKKKYVFDNDDFSVGKAERKGRKLALTILGLFVASISLTVVYYIVFALFFSTDKERALQNENRMLERIYPEMERKAELLEDVVEGLKVRDMNIYEDIFQTEAPELDRILDMNILSLTDSIAEEDIVRLTEAKADKLLSDASRVESNMREIMDILSSEEYQAPPMHLPLGGFSLPMTGASVVPIVRDGENVCAERGKRYAIRLKAKASSSAGPLRPALRLLRSFCFELTPLTRISCER